MWVLVLLGVVVFSFLVYVEAVIGSEEKEDRYGR